MGLSLQARRLRQMPNGGVRPQIRAGADRGRLATLAISCPNPQITPIGDGGSSPGTGKLQSPRVSAAGYQHGGLVYGEGGGPATVLQLGGDMSTWVLNGRGAATCTADLYYILIANGTGEWNGKGAQGGTVSLAHT